MDTSPNILFVIGAFFIVGGFARVLNHISGQLSEIIELLKKERDKGEEDLEEDDLD